MQNAPALVRRLRCPALGLRLPPRRNARMRGTRRLSAVGRRLRDAERRPSNEPAVVRRLRCPALGLRNHLTDGDDRRVGLRQDGSLSGLRPSISAAPDRNAWAPQAVGRRLRNAERRTSNEPALVGRLRCPALGLRLPPRRNARMRGTRRLQAIGRRLRDAERRTKADGRQQDRTSKEPALVRRLRRPAFGLRFLRRRIGMRGTRRL